MAERAQNAGTEEAIAETAASKLANGAGSSAREEKTWTDATGS